MFGRFRAAAGSLTLAFLVGAASIPSDSLGATASIAPLAAPQTLKTSGEPFAIAIDAQSGRAYVTDLKEDTLFVFDVASGGALAYIPTGRKPNHVVLSETRAFVSNFTDASITFIDTSTNRSLKTLPIGGLGLAINRETNRVYAAGGSRVSVLDGTSGATIATLPAPAGANIWGLAVDAAANRIYATDIASPRVLVYDGATNKLVAEIAIDAPARFGIAVGAAGQVFVASYTDQSPQLSMIDGASLKVAARVPIASFTTALLFDEVSDVVYASSAVDRSVTAISATLGGAPSKVTVEEGGGLAINPVTRELIVVTPGGAPPPARLPVDRATMAKP
jgi:YVTN family beta-propeller protein